MVATAPVHTMASHWLFSGTFSHQRELRDAFYQGEETDEESREFLREWGINYVVAPEGSPMHRVLAGNPKAAVFGAWTLYRIPGNAMREETPE